MLSTADCEPRQGLKALTTTEQKLPGFRVLGQSLDAKNTWDDIGATDTGTGWLSVDVTVRVRFIGGPGAPAGMVLKSPDGGVILKHPERSVETVEGISGSAPEGSIVTELTTSGHAMGFTFTVMRIGGYVFPPAGPVVHVTIWPLIAHVQPCPVPETGVRPRGRESVTFTLVMVFAPVFGLNISVNDPVVFGTRCCTAWEKSTQLAMGFE
jgi:hypothetical protein